jgi:hypothetical protein
MGGGVQEGQSFRKLTYFSRMLKILFLWRPWLPWATIGDHFLPLKV